MVSFVQPRTELRTNFAALGLDVFLQTQEKYLSDK